VLKLGFGTRARTQRFWDDLAGRSFPAAYKGHATVQGLTVDVFTQVIEPTPGGKVLGFDTVYSNTERTIYVEPTTGVIVKGVSHPKVVVKGTPFGDVAGLDATLTYDEATQVAQARTARDGRNSLRLVGSTLPLASLVAGLLLAGVGGLLVLRRRRAARTP
jgi:hypothetical protein